MSVAICALLAIGACSCSAPPARFESSDEAVAQLVQAMRAEDHARLVEIVGEENSDLVHSGDEISDRADRQEFIALFDEKHRLEELPDGTISICVGELDWPMPVPLVRDDGGWYFDGAAGREEILNRRIGENELDAVQVCLAIVDAQHEYYGADRDGDKIHEYARSFASSPGAHDGLFWPTAEGEPPSPLGELVVQAASEGYKRRDPGPTPYHGYLYRILEGQGDGAPGGTYDYLVRENMIGGFAVIAYPAEHGVSGVMSFIVSHDGVVYERDLGSGTAGTAQKMVRFEPIGWSEVEPTPPPEAGAGKTPGR
jgi:hypothetical protein